MTDPPRLLDIGTDQERAVLSALRAQDVPELTRRRLLARAGWMATLGLLTGKAAAAGLVITVGVVAVGAYWASDYFSSGEPVAMQAPAPVLPTEPVAPSELDRAERAEPQKDEALPEPAQPVDVAPAPRPKAAARAPSSPSFTLSDEIEAVDQVRHALRAGQPASALHLLDEYRQQYPSGRLGLEAHVLRIEALAKSGQSEQARRMADSFLERYPKSFLRRRVQPYASR